jgi:hypothetical protein
MVVREPVPGSRRDRYRLVDDSWYEVIVAKMGLIKTLADVAEQGVAAAGGPDTPAGARLANMRDLYLFVQDAMPGLTEQSAARKAATEAGRPGGPVGRRSPNHRRAAQAAPQNRRRNPDTRVPRESDDASTSVPSLGWLLWAARIGGARPTGRPMPAGTWLGRIAARRTGGWRVRDQRPYVRRLSTHSAGPRCPRASMAKAPSTDTTHTATAAANAV